VRIISLKMLRGFWEKHATAESPVRNWYTVVRRTRFADFKHMKQVFGSADYVSPYTVFNVGGNNYRVIVHIHYNTGKVFVRWTLTHREYDEWNKRYRKGRV
jgi:mRNA interferase HigB